MFLLGGDHFSVGLSPHVVGRLVPLGTFEVRIFCNNSFNVFLRTASLAQAQWRPS